MKKTSATEARQCGLSDCMLYLYMLCIFYSLGLMEPPNCWYREMSFMHTVKYRQIHSKLLKVTCGCPGLTRQKNNSCLISCESNGKVLQFFGFDLNC